MLADTPSGVAWEPYGAGERLGDRDELRELFAGIAGSDGSREALIWEMHEIRGHVLANGSLRWPVGQGFSEVLVAWAFYFDGDGRLRRAAACQSPGEAGRTLRAVEDAGRDGEPSIAMPRSDTE